jgi:hypothetical protein
VKGRSWKQLIDGKLNIKNDLHVALRYENFLKKKEKLQY